MNRVAVVPGSIRTGSLNRRLGRDLVARLDARGVEASLVDLAEYPMAIYLGDDEMTKGPPSKAVELHDRLADVDGLIVVTPEYNGGPPALLKNTIDWVTRVDRAVFRRHLMGLAATSPGGRGGQSVLAAMQTMFGHMRLEVHDVALSVPQGNEAFDGHEADTMVRPDVVAAAETFVRSYVRSLERWVVAGRVASA